MGTLGIDGAGRVARTAGGIDASASYQVLPQLQTDGHRQARHVDGRESLELGFQLVRARGQAGKAVLAIGFADAGPADAGISIAEREGHAGQHATLRVGDGALDLTDHLRVGGQRESDEDRERQ
jgi:hypothetical protein